VRFGREPPARFAAAAIAWADGVAARPRDRPQARLAEIVQARVFSELALNTQRIVRQARGASLQQLLDRPHELHAVDRAARDGEIHLDHGGNGARWIALV